MSTRADVREPAPPATPPTGNGGGGGGRWSRIVSARDAIEAELVKGVIEYAGVPVVLDRRDTSPFAWMHPGGNVNAPVAVLVPTTLMQAARLALMEANLLAPDGPPSRPPQASSRGARAVRLVVAALVVLMLGAYVLFQVMGGSIRVLSR